MAQSRLRALRLSVGATDRHIEPTRGRHACSRQEQISGGSPGGLPVFQISSTQTLDALFRKAKARACIMCAHDSFRRVLDDSKIANPTNEQIARVIGLSNWR